MAGQVCNPFCLTKSLPKKGRRRRERGMEARGPGRRGPGPRGRERESIGASGGRLCRQAQRRSARQVSYRRSGLVRRT